MDAAILETICAGLAEGRSLVSVCADEGMPTARTVQRWMDADAEVSSQITHAREVGYMARADRAILEAKTAEDAAKGRLAFDAERWYLGKLSNAFSDKQKHELTGKDGGAVAVTILTGVPRDDSADD